MGVAENPQTYANMRSKFSRFGLKPGVAQPLDIDYDTDVLNKASLETLVEGECTQVTA